ncbi:MAG: ABC transporter ATP-binding protein [Ferruginibacter sp.]
MSNSVIRVQNLGKLYRLGEIGTGTVSHDINRWLARIRGKEDPFAIVGQVNDRTKKATSDYVWALQDINFEVPQGQVLGIIGKNGAGKSTMLKLLSKVTTPSTGTISVKGRIASLLEVGTGFHPELTGRENIFLNGAILGMTKKEIRKKFDEIVDFAGVERYIDTPVKRYSSGMYVRLAFAVAAHLESEILIVDEVLAVGDAEFQKKCMGRMKDVSVKDGRTVLFVSHNMGSIKNLCDRVLVMEMGKVKALQDTPQGIETYLSSDLESDRCMIWEKSQRPGDSLVRLNAIKILNEKGDYQKSLTTDNDIIVEIEYEILQNVRDLRVTATVLTLEGEEIFITSDFKYNPGDRDRTIGVYRSSLTIPRKLLNLTTYYLSIDIEVVNKYAIVIGQTLSFTIHELIYNELGFSITARPPGFIHPVLDWKVEKMEEKIPAIRI